MLNSDYRPLCHVALPWAGRQDYMHELDIAEPRMKAGFEDYYEPVTRLLEAAGVAHGAAYMTVDEKTVRPGMSQRRPKPHVDGCFVPSRRDWSHPPAPGWLHNCNNIDTGQIMRMPIIVVASVAGCRAWRGRFDAVPSDSGDLSHIQSELGAGEVLAPYLGHLLSPDCIHESMVFDAETKRTFLRIALPVGSWSPTATTRPHEAGSP